MGRDRCEVNWIANDADADAAKGVVRWDPVHSIWNGAMLLGALVLGPLFFTPAAALAGIALTGAFLLLGHSVGFHRLLIHRSFETPKWLEYFLVWCGTVAGMSGPHWIIRTHDMRDWAQRQSHCHDYLAHRRPMLHDAWWQLHCRLDLAHPPRFDLRDVGRNRFYRFLEATWMAQQFPIAALLFWIGGWSFVVWGVFVRVALTTHGHWLVGHLAHRRGPQSLIVEDAGVQAHDVPWAGLITMGEAWHNNHHAYPGSAKIGIFPGQSDWGYRFIVMLEKLRLASNICLPNDMPERTLQLRRAA